MKHSFSTKLDSFAWYCVSTISHSDLIDARTTDGAWYHHWLLAIHVIEGHQYFLCWHTTDLHCHSISTSDSVTEASLRHTGDFIKSPSKANPLEKYGAMTQYWKSDFSHCATSSFDIKHIFIIIIIRSVLLNTIKELKHSAILLLKLNSLARCYTSTISDIHCDLVGTRVTNGAWYHHCILAIHVVESHWYFLRWHATDLRHGIITSKY